MRAYLEDRVVVKVVSALPPANWHAEMSRIELAPEVADDFDRILDHYHLVQYQVENPALCIREIIETLNVLEHNPMIGCPTNNDN